MSLDIERSPLNFYVVEIMQMSHPPQDIKKVTEGELKLIKGIYKKMLICSGNKFVLISVLSLFRDITSC